MLNSALASGGVLTLLTAIRGSISAKVFIVGTGGPGGGVRLPALPRDVATRRAKAAESMRCPECAWITVVLQSRSVSVLVLLKEQCTSPHRPRARRRGPLILACGRPAR